MKDPVRLIHGEGSALERLFLSHAAQEEPSESASALLLAPLFFPVGLDFRVDAGSAAPNQASPVSAPAAQAGGAGTVASGASTVAGGAGTASLHPGVLATTSQGIAWLGAGVLALGLAALGIGYLAQAGDQERKPSQTATNQTATLQASGQHLSQPQVLVQPLGPSQPQRLFQPQLLPGPQSPAQPQVLVQPQLLPGPQSPAQPQLLPQLEAQHVDNAQSRRPVEAAQPDTSEASARDKMLQADVATQSRSSQPTANLHEELALLEQVRTALRGGQTDAALRRLARYDSRFPQGALREEALVLRMEALHASGQTAAADALRSKFLVDHPDSPHQERVENTIRK